MVWWSGGLVVWWSWSGGVCLGVHVCVCVCASVCVCVCAEGGGSVWCACVCLSGGPSHGPRAPRTPPSPPRPRPKAPNNPHTSQGPPRPSKPAREFHLPPSTVLSRETPGNSNSGIHEIAPLQITQPLPCNKKRRNTLSVEGKRRFSIKNRTSKKGKKNRHGEV